MIAGFLRSFRFRLKCGSYGISWFFHNASIRAASFLATAIRALPGGWSGSSIWMATKLRSRTSLRCVQLELGTRIRAGKSPREPRWTLLAWLARSRIDRFRERRTAHVPDRSRRTMASWYAGWSAKSRKPPPNRSQSTRRFTIRRGTGGFPGRWAAREIPSLSVRTAWPEFWISYKTVSPGELLDIVLYQRRLSGGCSGWRQEAHNACIWSGLLDCTLLPRAWLSATVERWMQVDIRGLTVQWGAHK